MVWKVDCHFHHIFLRVEHHVGRLFVDKSEIHFRDNLMDDWMVILTNTKEYDVIVEIDLFDCTLETLQRWVNCSDHETMFKLLIPARFLVLNEDEIESGNVASFSQSCVVSDKPEIDFISMFFISSFYVFSSHVYTLTRVAINVPFSFHESLNV